MKKWLLLGLLTCGLCWADSGRVDVNEMLASMRLKHEANPQGISPKIGWWAKPSVNMGAYPHHDNVPSYWAPANLADFPGPWYSILPWFLAVRDTSPEASTTTASNTGVLVGPINLWFLSRNTRRWVAAESAHLPVWTNVYNASSGNYVSVAKALPSSEGQLYRVENGQFVHGGWGRTEIPLKNDDIAAVAVTVRHKLVLLSSDKPDDRARAHIIMMAAADYYPTRQTTPAQMTNRVPAAGLGRFLQVQNNWRTSTMIVKARDFSDADISAAGTPDW